MLGSLLLLAGVPQAPTDARPSADSPSLPFSVERVGEALRRTPMLRLEVRAPVVVFRSRVQRDYMPTFKEQLEREFTLNHFQRQSQDWSSKCCGVNLVGLAHGIDNWLKKREARRLREQIARELAEVEAAANKE